MIKRIELVNYMAHRRTVIEPAAGLTLLVGPNNCGKSAVASALETLCQNVTGDFMMRHGEKECSVTIETSEGGVVTWRRRKTPSYEIDGATISRAGNDKGALLARVHEVLRLPQVPGPDGADPFEIHIARQKAPIFLLSEPGSRAAVFFASSSDASRLLEIQKRHALKVRRKKEEERNLEADLRRLAAERDSLAPLSEIEPLVEKVQQQHRELTELGTSLTELTRLLQQLGETTLTIDRESETLRQLAGLIAPPMLEEPRPLASSIGAIEHAQSHLRLESDRGRALDPLASPPELTETRLLEKSLQEIAAASNLVIVLTEKVNASTGLTSPPELPSSASLDQATAGILSGLAEIERLRALHRTISTLLPPFEPRETSSLEILIRAFDEPLGEQARLGGSLAQIAADLARTEKELRELAARMGTCPTCGGELDPERLIQGGHVHG